VLEIELQGARQIRESMEAAVLIFNRAPSIEVLRERLRARGVDDEAGVQRRLQIAATELAARDEFPIVNRQRRPRSGDRRIGRRLTCGMLVDVISPRIDQLARARRLEFTPA